MILIGMVTVLRVFGSLGSSPKPTRTHPRRERHALERSLERKVLLKVTFLEGARWTHH